MDYLNKIEICISFGPIHYDGTVKIFEAAVKICKTCYRLYTHIVQAVHNTRGLVVFPSGIRVESDWRRWSVLVTTKIVIKRENGIWECIIKKLGEHEETYVNYVTCKVVWRLTFKITLFSNNCVYPWFSNSAIAVIHLHFSLDPRPWKFENVWIIT